MGLRRASIAPGRGASGRRSQLPLAGDIGRGLLWVRGILGQYLSVRAKLTLWYGLMCGLTLALAGFAGYTAIDRQLSTQIDGELQGTAGRLNESFDRSLLTQSNLPHTKKCAGADLAAIRRYCDEIQWTLNRESAVFSHPGEFEQVFVDINHSGLSPAQLTPLNRAWIQPADLSEQLFYMTELSGFRTFSVSGSTFRVYFIHLRVPGKLGTTYRGVLQVLQNETTYLNILQTVRLTLLLGSPVGLIIALIAGWLIARAALRPINRISRTVHAIGVSRDLSRRLNFVGPYDEVGRLAETFDGMMDRLERVFETQKRFIADASHELRTPLTTIRGNADLMRFAPPDEREVCLAAIRRESERMTRLVSDLLLLAEADVAEQQLQIRPVDIDEVVLEVYDATRLLAEGKVAVVLDQVDAVRIQGDADRLKQLFLNLADNAVKFTPVGGTVSLAVSSEPTGARVSVSDSGVGIPREEQEAIYRRFYRLEQSRSTRGSGLGLSICAWITAAHGGRIELSSEPGKGSTFTVYLPSRPPLVQMPEQMPG